MINKQKFQHLLIHINQAIEAYEDLLSTEKFDFYLSSSFEALYEQRTDVEDILQAEDGKIRVYCENDCCNNSFHVSFLEGAVFECPTCKATGKMNEYGEPIFDEVL